MLRSLRALPLVLLLASPAAAQGVGDCDVAKRLFMLDTAYQALLADPGSPRAREVATYAGIIARSITADVPEDVRRALVDLDTLATLAESGAAAAPMDPTTLQRHLDNAALFRGAHRDSGCPEPAPPPPAEDVEGADGTTPGSDPDRTGNRRLGEGLSERGALTGGAHASGELPETLGLVDLLRALFSRQVLLVVLGVLGGLAVAAAGMLAVQALASRRTASGGGAQAPGPLARLTVSLKRYLRNRRKHEHHILGRFFDILPAGTSTPKRIKVADISLGGAKLAWSGPPPVGSRMQLNLDGITRSAEVVWTNPHYCGVVFETLLAPAELKMILIPPEKPVEDTGELQMF